MSLYDEAPLRFMRWLNGLRYGWILLAVFLMLCLGTIAFIYGWIFGVSRR